MHGIADRPVAHLPSLAASLDYARRECAEAPATLELMIDGFYAVIHQEDGWPRQLVGPAPATTDFAQAELAAGNGRSKFGQWCERMTGRRRD